MTFERIQKELEKMSMPPEIDVKEVVGDEVFLKNGCGIFAMHKSGTQLSVIVRLDRV